MIKFKINVVLNDSQIQGLYQLYVYKNDGCRGTKKDFMDYMKTQVYLCGADEFLLSESSYEDLTVGDINQLMKWGLI